MDWYSIKMYGQWINKEYYEVHRYWIPSNLEKRVKYLRKYFRVMDREKIPHQHKRRKSGVEFADAAIMILGRIDQMCRLDIPFVAGSCFLASLPWAVFGEAPQVNATHRFRDIDDIANYYHNLIMKGGASPEYMHFRVANGLVDKISRAYHQTPHYVMSVALALLYDIMNHCGPDCEELYDLFTNDLRAEAEAVDIIEWQDIRCKVMGRFGRIKDKPYRYHLGQIYKPYVQLESETRIDLVSDDNDLATGERTCLAIQPRKIIEVPLEDDEYDDGTVAVESDVAYVSRIQDRADKYDYLGLSIRTPSYL